MILKDESVFGDLSLQAIVFQTDIAHTFIVRCGERERDRDRDRQRQRDRQTDRQTDRGRERHRETQRDRDTDRETETDRDRDTERQIEYLNFLIKYYQKRAKKYIDFFFKQKKTVQAVYVVLSKEG